MPDIHIRRDHRLGREGARRAAAEWQAEAEQRLSMRCTLESGRTQDRVHFIHYAATGSVTLSARHIEFEATLKFPFGMLRDTVAQKVSDSLDRVLASQAKPAAPRARPRKKP